MTDVAGFYKCY